MEDYEQELNNLTKRLMNQYGISMTEAVKRINALFASGIPSDKFLIESFLALPSEAHEKTNPRRQA